MAFQTTLTGAIGIGLILATPGTLSADPTVTFEKVHTLSADEGTTPMGSMAMGHDGTIYGTTAYGGQGGDGVIFQINQSGQFSVLHHFRSSVDGSFPNPGLAVGSDGALYGTTRVGGPTDTDGTVFKLLPNGTFKTIYQFTGGNDGRNPRAGLVFSTVNGQLYGSTQFGGANQNGTFFRVTTAGSFTRLHNQPGGKLHIESLFHEYWLDGNFYGVSPVLGANDGGTFFRFTPGGTLTTLYSFSASGITSPNTPLIAANLNGTELFYGTTGAGFGNQGAIYSVSRTGSFRSVHLFPGGAAGADPEGGLIYGPDDYLYGSTARGGAQGQGTIYRLKTDGSVEILYSLTREDGGYPTGEFLFADGWFYGTTLIGGTVFRFALPPSNDSFESPEDAGNNFDFNYGRNTGATSQDEERSHASSPARHTVWWKWKSPITGPVMINTFDSTFDTTLAVYTGLSLESLTLVVENDDANLTEQSKVVFQAVAQQEYRIAVDGKNGESGYITLRMALAPPPNDNIADAEIIGSVGGMYSGSNVGATREQNELPHNFNHTVWWQFSPSKSGVWRINGYASPISTHVTVYQGQSPDYQSLQLERNTSFGEDQYRLTEGLTYYIVVDTDNVAGGIIRLNVSHCEAPRILGFSEPIQESRADGIHVLICAEVTGNPTIFDWDITGAVSFTQNGACVEIKVDPASEEDLTISLNALNNCDGTGDTPGPNIPTCGICLSRGAPSLLQGRAGNSFGPSVDTGACGELSFSSRWYKLISQEAGAVTISAEGSPEGTILAVFTGSLSREELNPVRCAKSSQDQTARITFEPTPKVVYWVALETSADLSQLRLASGFDPRIEVTQLNSDGGFQLRSSAAPAITYQLQSTFDFKTWTTIQTTTLSKENPYLEYYEFPLSRGGKKYFRIAPGK